MDIVHTNADILPIRDHASFSDSRPSHVLQAHGVKQCGGMILWAVASQESFYFHLQFLHLPGPQWVGANPNLDPWKCETSTPLYFQGITLVGTK